MPLWSGDDFHPLDLYGHISQYIVLLEPYEAHMKKMLTVAAALIKSLRLTLGDPVKKLTVLPIAPLGARGTCVMQRSVPEPSLFPAELP